MAAGIYVHIPFCASKCPYCDFFSVGYSKENAEQLTSALILEMEQYRGRGITADTLYFGGGTPSLLPPPLLCRIIDSAAEIFALKGEITIEANPNTVSKARLSEYIQIGINRISFGVQSSNSRELAALGRRHTALQAATAIENAYEAGFFNISADIMLGVPYGTVQSALQTVDFLAALPTTHISAYMLKIEENTPYGRGELPAPPPNDDLQAEIYLAACEHLEQAGFMQYEISNFAKNGLESRHNLKYWLCEDYIGLGPSAHSLCGGKRFCNPSSLPEYIKSPCKHIITDTSPCSREEKLMLALRLTSGISLSQSEEDTLLLSRAKPYINAGLIAKEGNTLHLTRRGFLLSNSIIAELVF